MNTAAPKGRPRGGLVTKVKKTSLPLYLKRGPDAGICRIQYDFHGSGVNPLDRGRFFRTKNPILLKIYNHFHKQRT